jgi:hypothetical protein
VEQPPPPSPGSEPDSRARFHGTIAALRGDTLTIAPGPHPRKNAKNLKAYTFKLHTGTRFEVVGRPGITGPQPGQWADLHKGDTVVVQASGERASRADVVAVHVAPPDVRPTGDREARTERGERGASAPRLLRKTGG